MEKKILMVFTIIGIVGIGSFLAYSALLPEDDTAISSETAMVKTEQNEEAAKEGEALSAKHGLITSEYQEIQSAYSNGLVSEKEYNDTIVDLQKREKAVFEEAGNYNWQESEIKEYNYFFRGVMKFPTELERHSARDVPPVFDDLKKQQYCELVREFELAYAEFDALFPGPPTEDDFENADDYGDALSEYASLRTSWPKFVELEEEKARFGDTAHIECN